METAPTVATAAMPALKPLPPIFHPKTIWQQDGKTLTLNVQLRGVKSISLRATSTEMLFWTDHDGKRYVLLIKFFSEIIPAKSSHSFSGNGVTLSFTKMKTEQWPRLSIHSEKLPYIVYEDMDDEDKLTFADIRKLMPPLKKSEYEDYYGDGLPPEEACKYLAESCSEDDDLEKALETDDEDSNLDTDEDEG